MLNKGDFVTLIGETGSGKSTFLKQLLPNLTAGDVTGKLITNIQRDTNSFAYVSQFVDNQMVMETPRDELKFVLDNQGCTNDEIQLRITEIASYLSIVSLLDKTSIELSGGQKQLINLACALILKPQVLLLDEPTAQLDPIAAEKLLQVVHKVNEEFNLTVIIVEHELEQTIKYANRLVVMENGQIILDQDVATGLKAIFQKDSYRNYLTQADRLALELGYQHVDLPLSNRQLQRLIDSQQAKLRYQVQSSNKGLTETILSVDKLNFRFGFNAPQIIDHVSLNLQKGKSFCVVGPNGMGKTTLLKTITQQLTKQSGRILFHGQKINQEFFEKVFVLPQNPATLFVKDTVQAELEYQLQTYHSDLTIEQLLTKFSLADLEQTSPYDLSGGQQEFLALALGFIKQPEILFLDEPTKGLDPNKRLMLGQMLLDFQENGGTIMANSHDLLFAANYFDYVAMMFDGKLSQFQEPRQFFSNKFFYTTEINKALRDIFPLALSWKDIQKIES